MSIILETVRAIFISFEFVVILAASILFFHQPHLVNPISSQFADSPEVLKYVAFIPMVLFIWVMRESQNLLFPAEDPKKILQKWKDYRKLKILFYVAICYSLLFASVGVLSWATGMKISDPKGFIIISTSVFGGIIVAFSVYLANISLKETLSGIHKK